MARTKRRTTTFSLLSLIFYNHKVFLSFGYNNSAFSLYCTVLFILYNPFTLCCRVSVCAWRERDCCEGLKNVYTSNLFTLHFKGNAAVNSMKTLFVCRLFMFFCWWK